MKDGYMMGKKNKAWQLKDQEEFLKRVGELYENGYSLLDALILMSIHYDYAKKKKMVGAINQLKSGLSIHAVLEKLHFHQDVLSLLFFSQKHGNLGQAFLSAGTLMERKRYYREKLITLVTYPIMLLFFVIVMFIFVQTILLPQFNQLFIQMNIQLNPVISLFFSIVTYVPIMMSVFLGLSILSFLFFRGNKKLKPSKKIDFFMKLPLLKTFLSLHYSHYFTQQLSTLLQSGLTINDSLSVFEQQNYQPYFQGKAIEFRKRLLEGEKLETLVKKEKVFVEGLPLVIVHGQKNGKLAQELEQFSKLLLVKLQERGEKVMSKIQPCLFVFVGAFVFLLYICIFIPMFQLLGGI